MGIDLRAEHEDLTAKTYQVIRDLIVTRAVGPGDKLTADGLSQRFGVSRTTVKNALDQLEAEGLVVVRPQVGTFVRGLTARDVRDLWDARLMIETFAARRGVLVATEEQREELRAIVEAMAPLVDGDEYREAHAQRAVALHRRLHRLVVETADNPYLLVLHRQIRAHMHIVDYRSRLSLRRASRGLEQHRTIAEAYARRDPTLAVTTLKRHIEQSRDTALQAIAKLGDVL
ncbi:MAG TPA: GntR family transcriptional regulator [Chloroflexota bacterium]|jgi:DNA-binding GntR family transcriptional regulator|nr:GntR family transcriptional regulator [Chloroflexota bacterium]